MAELHERALCLQPFAFPSPLSPPPPPPPHTPFFFFFFFLRWRARATLNLPAAINCVYSRQIMRQTLCLARVEVYEGGFERCLKAVYQLLVAESPVPPHRILTIASKHQWGRTKAVHGDLTIWLSPTASRDTLGRSGSTVLACFVRLSLNDRCDRLKLHLSDRLAGLVVKASASGTQDPGFDSRLRRDFFRVESYW